MPIVITTHQQFYKELGVNHISHLKKSVYNATDCGAWVTETHNGFEIGSIVEGSDASTPTHKLMFPFYYETFWKELGLVDDEAKAIWDRIDF